jgi:pyruvate,water dikinase
MERSTNVVSLDDPEARDPGRTGSKAANLATARQAGLPALGGVVLTTSWSPDDHLSAMAAFRTVSDNGARAVVVRSSSTGEDGAASSMAGVFDSVIDVDGEAAFVEAVETVLGSAATARLAGMVDAPMAVLVQPMLRPEWGGVLFGADPVTGRRDRLVVAAVAGGPAALVAGEVDGWTAVLDKRGRVKEVRSPERPDAPRPPADALRGLARLAATAAATYGGPQDLEWAVDHDGSVVLLQARPITTLLPTAGVVYGSGPVAVSFPEPLAALEQDLWLDPLREGLREALLLAGMGNRRAIERSSLVVTVDGMAAADLAAIGADETAGGIVRRLDPRPPARRLRAAWRVGRLRSALPELAADIVHRIDGELLDVPELSELSNLQLLAILRNSRRSLLSLHGHEALAGLLIPEASAATVTGASLALSALAQAKAEGVALCDLVEHDPVVLALVPPRIAAAPAMDALEGVEPPPHVGSFDTPDPDPAAVAREALRLRVRWVQELTARAAWELGRRLVDVGVLPTHESVRLLRLEELTEAVQRRHVPADLAERVEPAGRHLPSRFRLSDHGAAIAVPASSKRRRRGAGSVEGGGVGAGGGVGTGPVHIGATDVPDGSVLVVGHLDPRLASLIPRLAGLVAETGNALSHLAILAREHHVPVVVGLPDATTKFTDGDHVTVDGVTGAVQLVDVEAPSLATTGAPS